MTLQTVLRNQADLHRRLVAEIHTIQETMSNVDSKVEEMHEKVNEVEEKIDEAGGKFDSLDDKVDRLGNDLDQLSENTRVHIEDLKYRCASTQNILVGLQLETRNEFKNINARLDNLEKLIVQTTLARLPFQNPAPVGAVALYTGNPALPGWP